MLHWQFNTVTDQRLARQQLIHRGIERRTKRMDQPNTGGITPDKHGTASHQICLNPLGHHDTFINRSGLCYQPLKRIEIDHRISQSMRQIKDRAAGILAVHTAKSLHALWWHRLKHHPPGCLYRRQLSRITKQHKRRENLLQVRELLGIQHRTFVDKTNVHRLFAALPSGNEIRPTQTRSSQRGRNRFMRLIRRKRAV